MVHIIVTFNYRDDFILFAFCGGGGGKIPKLG